MATVHDHRRPHRDLGVRVRHVRRLVHVMQKPRRHCRRHLQWQRFAARVVRDLRRARGIFKSRRRRDATAIHRVQTSKCLVMVGGEQ